MKFYETSLHFSRRRAKFGSKSVHEGEPQMNRPGLPPAFFVMPFWVYILQSQSTGRYYCGYSSDPERRLRQHNDPRYSLSKSTKRFPGPWRIVWSQSCETRGRAMVLEKAIKKRGIQRFLHHVQPAESRQWRD